MTITIYRNNSSPSHLDKDIVQLWQGTGTFREATSVLTPSFTVEGDLSPYMNRANYFFIDDFSRYYVLNDFVAIQKNLYALSGTVDALMSWREEIRKNGAIIARQENAYNLNLNDGVFKSEQQTLIQRLNFPSGFTEREFILAVAGGLST